MKFKPAPPNPFYDDHNYFNRLESENGRWTITCHFTVMGSTRIYAGITNQGRFALDNCAGNQIGNICEVLLVTILFVEQFEETATENEVQRAWPRFEWKPLTDNPEWADFRDRVIASYEKSLVT